MTEKQLINMLEGVLSQAKCLGGDLTKLVTGIRSLVTFLKAMDESE